MVACEDVTAEEFAALVASSSASDLFKARYGRFSPTTYDGWNGPSFKVFRGDVTASGPWKAPGLNTLVLGDLSVSGSIDLANPHDEGFDEGGQFVVLGDVECRGFVGEGGKCIFIDGDLVARDAIANAFEDASLIVVGDFRTRFFIGVDIWANVGGTAEIEAGDGYCMPLDGVEADWDEVRPRLDAASSLALLKPGLGTVVRDEAGQPLGLDISCDELRDRMSRGETIFADRQSH